LKTIWDKYHYDRKIIDEFLAAFEIKVQGAAEPINWKNTLSKILVWDGFNMDLKYDYSTLIQNRKTGYLKPIAKFIIKFFKKKSHLNDIIFPHTLKQSKILFFLKNRGEAEILLPLLNGLYQKTDFAIVYEHDDTKELYKPFEFIKLNTLSFGEIKIGFGIKKIPNNKSMFVLNNFLNEQANLEKYLSFFTHLKTHNNALKKVVFVAGENKYAANLCHQVFKNTLVKTENLMNGAKYGWPNDADVDFDTWYVWNEKMKLFLNENAKVPAEILKVVGHPLEHQIKNHKYSNKNNALNQFQRQFDIIVTLFSTSLQFEKKFTIYKMVIDFVKQNPKMGLIIKAHQSDKEVSFFNPYKDDSQISFFEGFSKNLLLDIINVSQVTLSFGSTVSFESIWMGVPNISYEEAPKSLLPIEGELFYHINKEEELIPKLQQILNEVDKSKVQSNTMTSVVEKYVDFIVGC